MGTRRAHISLDEGAFAIIMREAKASGVSLSRYLEIAGVARAVVDRHRRDPELMVATTELLEAARRYVEASDTGDR